MLLRSGHKLRSPTRTIQNNCTIIGKRESPQIIAKCALKEVSGIAVRKLKLIDLFDNRPHGVGRQLLHLKVESMTFTINHLRSERDSFSRSIEDPNLHQ